MITRCAQQGITLIGALFVIVALGALAAVMGQLATTQQLSTRDAVEGKQAWYAARAGLEQARYALVVDERSCADVNGNTLDWAGFTVEVSCETGADNPVVEAGETFWVFQVNSVATKGANADDGIVNPIRREANASIWREEG